jgi:hypothetical protein
MTFEKEIKALDREIVRLGEKLSALKQQRAYLAGFDEAKVPVEPFRDMGLSVSTSTTVANGEMSGTDSK